MSIARNLTRVRATLPKGVTLIAVSKTHPIEAVVEAYAAGQRVFGENRPQELAAKAICWGEAARAAQLSRGTDPRDIQWHLIGHLQTNKVRMVMPHVTMIESVDSIRLVEAIETEAAKIDRVVDILLEIHVADEASKTGWAWDELLPYVQSGAMQRMTHVRVRGVMGIASHTSDETIVRRDFATLRRYKETIALYFDTHSGSHFDTLSMGMSHDYPLAIAEGATQVRIGSSIFGSR